MVIYTLGALEVLRCTQDYLNTPATVFAILLFHHYRSQSPPAAQEPANEAPPTLPGGSAIDAPAHVGVSRPSLWWWQRLIKRSLANDAARTARVRATREARDIAQREDTDYQLEVDRIRGDQLSVLADPEYLQRLRDMKAGMNVSHSPRNDGERPTAERGWDTTRPFSAYRH